MGVPADRTGAARKPLGDVIIALVDEHSAEAARYMLDRDTTRNATMIKAAMLEVVVRLMQALDDESAAVP